MQITKYKKLIIWGTIAGLALIGAIIALLLLLPKKEPDPHTLLQTASTRSEQNLCLMAILEKEPENKEAQTQLLANYQALGADPLTIKALTQQYGISASQSAEVTPENPGAVLNTAGIAKRKTYKNSYAVAEGKDTTYYATSEGIYADYNGLNVKISDILADGLTATEGGIYFINIDQRKVQYLARDGHKIQTISLIDAQSFAFFNEHLWIVGLNGALYCADSAIETPAPIRMVVATQDALYASFNGESGRAEGVLTIDKAGRCEVLLSSPAFTLFGGKDDCLYYINAQGYPMRYDPAKKEAAILAEKKAVAVTHEEGTVYYINEKGKIKKIA